MVTGKLFLMPLQLAVQLVRKRINGSIHICVHCIGEQVTAGDIDGCLGLLIEFFHSENNVRVSSNIEVSLES